MSKGWTRGSSYRATRRSSLSPDHLTQPLVAWHYPRLPHTVPCLSRRTCPSAIHAQFWQLGEIKPPMCGLGCRLASLGIRTLRRYWTNRACTRPLHLLVASRIVASFAVTRCPEHRSLSIHPSATCSHIWRILDSACTCALTSNWEVVKDGMKGVPGALATCSLVCMKVVEDDIGGCVESQPQHHLCMSKAWAKLISHRIL
jgi:hypothetical protein